MLISVEIKNEEANPAKQLKRIDKNLTKYVKKTVPKLLIKDYDRTVDNWKGKPEFTSDYVERGFKRVKVFPKGRNTLKWQRVSGGTGPRKIRAKKKNRAMRFPRNYTPKTTPGGQYGGPGRKHGPIVLAREVTHRIAPREFSIKIKEKREDEIVAGVGRVIRRSVR